MRVTRRRFLAVGGLGVLLAACGQAAAPTPAPTAKPAAAAPTTAPAAAAAATSAPATAATSAPAAGAATKPAAAAGATTAPASAPAAGAKSNVTIKAINHIGYGAEIDKTVFPPYYQIFQQKTGITVEETILPEDQQFPVKILTMIAGNTAPDAVFIHPQWLASMASKGALKEVDSYVKDPTVKFDDFWPGALTYYQFPHGAKTYALPYYSGPSVWIFN